MQKRKRTNGKRDARVWIASVFVCIVRFSSPAFRFINIAFQYRIRNPGVNTISLPAAIYTLFKTQKQIELEFGQWLMSLQNKTKRQSTICFVCVCALSFASICIVVHFPCVANYFFISLSRIEFSRALNAFIKSIIKWKKLFCLC